MLDSNVPRPWQGRTTLVFSLAAVALGLGNLFRLPWLIGEHGGGPFFLAYVAAVLVLAVPIMLAEVTLGSFGRGSPLGSLRWAADQSGRSARWQWLGIFQVLLAFALAVQVGFIAVWLAERAIGLQLGDLAAASPRDMASDFLGFIGGDGLDMPVILILVLVAGTLAMPGPSLAMGVIGWLVLPGIVVTLLGLVDYSLNFGSMREAEEFLFRRDTGRFSFDSAVAAVVSAAFTLGAGLGVGMAFGSRSPTGLPLARSVLAAAVLDTLLLLTVAVVVVPLLFAVNVQPAEGMPLVFVALPYAFANLPLGEAYGALFFAAMAAACFAAFVALLEPAIMVLRGDFEWPRSVSVVAVMTAVWLAMQAASADPVHWLIRVDALLSVLLPLCFLCLAMFVGWRMPRPLSRGELYRTPNWLFDVWIGVLRWVVPLLCLLILVRQGGLVYGEWLA